MSKNKVMWNLALFLIVVLTLPIVHAQTLAGSRIYYIVINAFVIGIVLFILQAVLVPGKPDKERVSAWIIVVIASLVLAFIFGENGFIWKTGPLAILFNLYVIVNSIIIAGVLYFVLGFLKFEQLKSAEGKTGYGILLFLIAVVITINVAPDRFIWQQVTLRGLIGYLFSGEQYTGPGARPGLARGLLHYRGGLIVGITGFLVISFFFKHWLIKEDSNKWLNYALAALFAYHLAAPPANALRDVVFMGELAFTLIVLNSMKTTFGGEGKKLIVSVVASMFIVGMASTLLTLHSPENRGFYGWVGCHFGFIFHCDEMPGVAGMPGVGSGSGGFSSSTMIIFAVLLAAFLIWAYAGGESGKKYGGWGIGLTLLALILYWAFSAGGSASGKIFGSLGLIALVILGLFLVMFRGETRRRILTMGMRGLKKRANAIFRTSKYLENWVENREPPAMRENRLLLHAIANYTVRSEITYRYYGFVEQAKRVGGEVIEQKIEKHTNKDALMHDLIVTRSGGITEEEGAHFEGWNRINLEIVDLVNKYFETLYLTYIALNLEFKTATAPKTRTETNIMGSIRSRADDLKEKIGKNKKQYDDRMKAYGGHHVLDAYRYIVLSMTNVTGEILQHPQLFARPKAKFDMGNYRTKTQDPVDGKNEYASHDAKGLPTDEVNQFGEVIADINEEKKKQEIYNRFGKLKDPRLYKKPRKVKPNDIIYYPDYKDWCQYIENDWQALAEDIRYGMWHPESRTYKMYEQALDHGVYPEWRDDKIPLTLTGAKLSNPPGTGDEAFDMRAIAYLGKNVYWGRDNFYVPSPPNKDSPFHNPYPLVTSGGLKKYLRKRLLVSAQDPAKMEEFMKTIPADTMASRKIVRGGKVEVPIGTTLADTSSHESTEGQ